MAEKQFESKMTDDIEPCEEERQQYNVRTYNGIELGIGQHDSNLKEVQKLAKAYPHHLILIQAGGFLHAYDKSAYFLHKTKGYKVKLVNTEADPHLRVGFPLKNHKRRLWAICAQFKVPYVVALGTKGRGYTVHISDEAVKGPTLMDEIPEDLVARLLNDLVQEEHVINAKAMYSLLRGDVTFRLKKVAQDLHELLMRDIAKLPRNHRHIVGQEMRECISRVMRSVFLYSHTDTKLRLLTSLSADIDQLKYLLQESRSMDLIDADKFSSRATLVVELGSITGGLIRKVS